MENAGRKIGFSERLESLTAQKQNVREQAEFLLNGRSLFKSILEQINRLDTILDNMEKKGESPNSPNMVFWSSIRDSLIAAAFLDDELQNERKARDLASIQLDAAMIRIRHLEQQLAKFQAAEVIELGPVMGSYEAMIKSKIKTLNKIGS